VAAWDWGSYPAGQSSARRRPGPVMPAGVGGLDVFPAGKRGMERRRSRHQGLPAAGGKDLCPPAVSAARGRLRDTTPWRKLTKQGRNRHRPAASERPRAPHPANPDLASPAKQARTGNHPRPTQPGTTPGGAGTAGPDRIRGHEQAPAHNCSVGMACFIGDRRPPASGLDATRAIRKEPITSSRPRDTSRTRAATCCK
jgi:hypothetical protein